MRWIVALLAALAASPVQAQAVDPVAIVDLFEQRCVAPLEAGRAGDISGLRQQDGAGDGSSDEAFPDVIPGVTLRVMTAGAGLQGCSLEHYLTSDEQRRSINEAIAERFGDRFGSLPVYCPSDGLAADRILESADRNPRGNLVGILSFVIRIDGQPDLQNLTAAESDVPLIRHEACDE